MKETTKKTAQRRRLEGVVVSAKTPKTIVVRVDRMKLHPKYRKRFIVSKKFHVHDENGVAKMGETVVFEETRKLSATKCWRLVSSKS